MDLRNLQIDSNWIIFSNAPIYDIILPNTLIFSAFNSSTGKNLSIYYENEKDGFYLEYTVCDRKNANWDYSTSNIQRTKKSINLKELYEELSKYLNIYNKDLVPIAFFGGWQIVYNNFLLSTNNYDEIEYLFFCTKKKNYIEITYHKNDNSYMIDVGRTKYYITEGSYQISNKNLINTYSFTFFKIEDVVIFIENYLENPEKIIGN